MKSKSLGILYGGAYGLLSIWTLKFVSDRYFTQYCLPSSKNSPNITGKDIDSLGEFEGHHQWTNYRRYQCDEISRHNYLHENATLKCYRSFVNGVRPVFIEVMNRRPLVLIFRQAFCVTDAQKLADLVANNATRTTVNNKGVRVNSEVRVVNGSWVALLNHSDLSRSLGRRLEDLSGFNFEGVENAQILFYKKGGHYAPHYDYFSEPVALTWRQKLHLFGPEMRNIYAEAKSCFGQENNTFSSNLFCSCNRLNDGLKQWWNVRILDMKPHMDSGNRIASLLAYIQTPEKGGGTLFPNLNLTLTPNSGDVLLWFNMLPNQSVEADSIHSGCPVVEGNKTAVVVWVREKGQELMLRCPKEESKSYWVQDFLTGAFNGIRD